MPKRDEDYWANQREGLRYCYRHKRYYKANAGCPSCRLEKTKDEERARELFSSVSWPDGNEITDSELDATGRYVENQNVHPYGEDFEDIDESRCCPTEDNKLGEQPKTGEHYLQRNQFFGEVELEFEEVHLQSEEEKHDRAEKRQPWFDGEVSEQNEEGTDSKCSTSQHSPEDSETQVNRCPNCGNYAITRHHTHCPFCGYALRGESAAVPSGPARQSRTKTQPPHYASAGEISQESDVDKFDDEPLAIQCPSCGNSSLAFNDSTRLFECFNPKCRRFSVTLVGMLGYDDFVEVKMKWLDRVIKLFSPNYDPDKKLIGECNAQEIKDLLPNMRVLKFASTGVTDRRVVLDKSEQGVRAKVVASMVINYWIAKGVSLDIIDKIESVRAYKVRGNKANEVLFEYKLADPRDDSSINILNKAC
ncbi:MAG: hypothetical protein ACOC7P_00225 [Chloroflexota bacterium]